VKGVLETMDSTDVATRMVRFERDVPVAAEVDVLVVGGGPAGIGAAWGSARAGAATALVEQYGFLGGMSTAGLVGPFMTSFSGDGRTQIIGGVFDELVRRMEAQGGAIHPQKVRSGSPESGYYVYGHDHVTPFDPEMVKIVAADMLLEQGVQLWLHTRFIEPLLDGNRLRGAVIHSKSGLQAVLAKAVVDCSADADVAFRAGAPTVKGRAQDGLMQPMTMFFQVANIDEATFDAFVQSHPEQKGRLFHDLVKTGRESGEFPVPRTHIGVYRSAKKGVWWVNTSRLLGLDGTDVRDLTRAEVDGRKQAMALLQFFRQHLPGFGQATLVRIAPQVGVRETRRIVGEYVVTAQDLISGRHFDDVVALASFPIDIHSVDGSGNFFGGDESGAGTAAVYEVPYRALVPKAVDGLLAAGRCLSATHEAAAALRVMPPAFATGQAAGVGAATAVAESRSPREVSIARVQQTLRAQGAILAVAAEGSPG